MRKAIIILSLAVMVLSASAVYAQYTGSWNYTWNFDNGMQGFTLGKAGTVDGTWFDAGVMPTLPDGGISGSKAGDFASHNGTVQLPDKSYARMDVSSLNLGIGTGRRGFIAQVDVYIPNLYPLTGFTNNYPGNMNNNAGIQFLRADGKAVYLEGTAQYGGINVKDQTWDNSTRRFSWNMEELGAVDADQWWDKWITLQLDYGYSVANQFSAYAYIPWESPVGKAGWYTITTARNVNPNIQWTTLQIGGTASWTQAEFDNVRLLVAPEPSSMLALASGLCGLVGFSIHRRK